jgi:tetratricopeptide (TPR) repeat protein
MFHLTKLINFDNYKFNPIKKLKFFITIIVLLLSLIVRSQNDQLAQNYFEKGDFEKALISFEDLIKTMPQNAYYFQKTIDCAQQLQQYDKVEKSIVERLKTYKYPNLLVELGYNYQLKKDQDKATKFYNQALDKINYNPNEVYTVAQVFEKKGLLDYAILAFETATKKDPKLSFNYQTAILYGQKGNSDLMIEKLLTESYINPNILQNIQYQLTIFMNESGSEKYIESLKKGILLKSQDKNLDSKDVFWNQYLSWFFVQQKEFGKAFIQQKSIFKRNPESFNDIINLAQMAVDENDTATAQDIYAFILENTMDNELKIRANCYIQNIKINAASDKDYPAITSDLELLIKQFGFSPYSLPLQKLQAHFIAFNLKKPDDAKTMLKKALDLPITELQKAEIKMELADILLFQEKFNQALIYYSQIEDDVKNSTIANEASLKIAKTSYFQTDFKWASKQLKVLKSASTQLIANDAIDLFLLLSDNTVADSTQVALKKFAHADFLLYQNRSQEALLEFQALLKDNKTIEIEPITYFRVGKIYEKQQDLLSALSQYQKIIDNHKDCIYIDEAYYFSAEIYAKQNDFVNAKKCYEEIIFKHQDSIYFTEARKKYRTLRGDKEL